MSEREDIKPEDLVIHFLNVGFGDNIILQFPAGEDGVRKYGLVDCRKGEKTLDYLGKLMQPHAKLAFICATHPHSDHISGISSVIDSEFCPEEFWDSGFRQYSLTYRNILLAVIKHKIKMLRVSSGLEWYFNRVKITALSPSIALRNRYATYGVDMNNASIVLRIENSKEDVLLTKSREYDPNATEEDTEAGPSVVILAGDAEFDSWSHICQEYPRIERTSYHDPLVKKMVNYLGSSVIKVAHHGSMHSTPLDVYEKMTPSLAIISTKQSLSSTKRDNTPFPKLNRSMFPHQSSVAALEESDVRVVTTDGSYEGQVQEDGTRKDPENVHTGSIVVVVPPKGKIRWLKMEDSDDQVASPPSLV